MWGKVRNGLVYIALFSGGLLLGFWVFDRIAMPAIIGSGRAYPIPNLVGMTTENAENLAKLNGFRFKISRQEFSTLMPAGRIISQIPKAKSLAKKGRTIRVIVSKGSAITVVPDVCGKLLRQAQIAIEDAKLTVGNIERKYCDSITNGCVISVEPEPGETVAVGTSVNILVSLGKESGIVVVPNLVGMQADDACKTLSSSGLKCKIVKRRIPTIENGEVFKQDPMPGTKVYRGNVVLLMVNQLD